MDELPNKSFNNFLLYHTTMQQVLQYIEKEDILLEDLD